MGGVERERLRVVARNSSRARRPDNTGDFAPWLRTNLKSRCMTEIICIILCAKSKTRRASPRRPFIRRQFYNRLFQLHTSPRETTLQLPPSTANKSKIHSENGGYKKKTSCAFLFFRVCVCVALDQPVEKRAPTALSHN